MDDLPAFEQLDAGAMAELQFMLFEAMSMCSNMPAREPCASGPCHAAPDGPLGQNRHCRAWWTMARGFDPAQARGNGLHVMRERARPSAPA